MTRAAGSGGDVRLPKDGFMSKTEQLRTGMSV